MQKVSTEKANGKMNTESLVVVRAIKENKKEVVFGRDQHFYQ